VIAHPEFNEEFDVYHPIMASDVERYLRADPSIQAIHITSPSYEGYCSDIAEIREVIGPERLLVVDEVHGVHFYFSDQLPKGALEEGADLTVQSMHKFLGT